MSLLWSDASTGVQVVQQVGMETTSPTGESTGATHALICLFEQIAFEEGWQPHGALRLWPSRSVYFALALNGTIAGGLQLVLPDAATSLPCFAVWPEVEQAVPCRAAAHVAILALDAPFRGRGLLFWRLAIEMWRYCVGHGITQVFIEVTPRVLPLYQRLGWPLAIRGELRVHWGETCYLCCLGIPEVAEAILRRAEHSDYYRQIIAQAFRLPVLPSSVEEGEEGLITVEPLQAVAA